jgi:hypothetical protein
MRDKWLIAPICYQNLRKWIALSRNKVLSSHMMPEIMPTARKNSSTPGRLEHTALGDAWVCSGAWNNPVLCRSWHTHKCPLHLRDPSEMVKTSSRRVDERHRQTELPRVPDDWVEMVLCQGTHVSLKPPVREEHSKAFARAPGTS